ncbi:Solvent efflux pump outer membrane protein SrpC [bacterium HR15]|nr:Solvent efflux pump outer membrane protein SrpC [bacterium HR15]
MSRNTRFAARYALHAGRHLLLTLLMCLATAFYAQTDSVQPLTLEEAIRMALKGNRALQIAQRTLEKARERVSEARGAGNLQIQSSSTYTRFDRVATARFGPQEVRLGNIENRVAVLTLTQPVDISGIIRTGVRAASLGYELTLLDYERTRNELILQVTNAYQNVARAESFVRVAEEALKNAQERLRITRTQVDTGVASRFDLLRAETQVAQNEQALLNARNQVEIAKAALNNLLGRDLNAPVQVVLPDSLPAMEQELDALIHEAYARRPELRAAERNRELARVNIDSARRGNLPTLALNGQWNFNLNTSVFNPRRQTFTATAILSFPVFDGGITRARVEQAREDLQIAEINLQQVKEGIALEVRTAYLNLKDAQKRLEVARKGLEQATEALRLARIRYEAGVSPQLEISDAELAYTQAQTNLINAQFDYLNAYAALQKAVGTIGERYAALF